MKKEKNKVGIFRIMEFPCAYNTKETLKKHPPCPNKIKVQCILSKVHNEWRPLKSSPTMFGYFCPDHKFIEARMLQLGASQTAISNNLKNKFQKNMNSALNKLKDEKDKD